MENLEQAEGLRQLGKLNKAALPARRAYSLAEKHLPTSHPIRQAAARTLGLILRQLNQQQEAERLLRESGDLGGSEADEADIDRRNSEIAFLLQSDPTPKLAALADEVLAKPPMQSA